MRNKKLHRWAGILTALDGETTQEWIVTVTQEEEPVDPPTSSSKIVKLGGLILKL